MGPYLFLTIEGQCLPGPLKTWAGRADGNPMSPHPEDPDSNQSNGPLDANPDGDSDYSAFSDQQLIAQRDRHRRHLDELTTRPASSPAVCQSLVRIEQEIEQITEELTRRARSSRPPSRTLSGRLRSLRSVSWPPRHK